MRLGAIALYAATAGGFAVAVRAVVGRPPPIDWALFGLGGYSALIVVSVLVPQLGTWGEIVGRGRGARGVAITIDVLGGGDRVAETLAILARHDAVATFFFRGEMAEKEPELLQSVIAAGHEIGTLGQRKDQLAALRLLPTLERDIERSIAAIERVTSERPALYRPPRGVTTPRIVRAADDAGLVVLGWTSSVAEGSVLRVVTNARVGARLDALLAAIAARQLDIVFATDLVAES